MPASHFKSRRATMDDLPNLERAWRTMDYDPAVLAKRATEFQIVESVAGDFVGSLGLSIADKQGRIHSEAFLDYAQADFARETLWERLHILAQNHGLLRFWTTEDAPFWKRAGFDPPDEKALDACPAAWKTEPGRWLTLKLRDDVEALIKADAEFALFMQAEREKSLRTIQRARVLRLAVTLLAFLAFGVAAIAAFYLFRRNRSLLGR